MFKHSIGLRLTAIIVALVVTSNCIGYLVLTSRQDESLQQTLVHTAEARLASFAQDFVKLSIFDDPQPPIKIVNHLRQLDDTLFLQVHSNDGSVILRYRRPNFSGDFTQAESPSTVIANDILKIKRPIIFQNHTYGQAYIYLSTEPLTIARQNALNSLLISLVATLIFAIIFAWILQRNFTRPILNINKELHEVITSNNFHHEIAISQSDEIGQLGIGLNRLLEHIRTQQTLLIDDQDRLELMVAKRTRALTEANKELESFSYSVSHDLRSPLRSIDGFSLALIEDYEEQLPPEAQDYIHRLRAAAQRMGELIDDLLNLSRVSRQALNLEQLSVQTMVEEITSLLRNEHKEKSIYIEIELPHEVSADANLIRIVLENIIGNAIKYSAHRSISEIKIFSEQLDNGTRISVTDNGAGFDMQYANKLFMPFQRLHSDKQFEGSGIGLATVARIVNKHNGKVGATSEGDQGATFFVEFPNPD